jgi:hypothetical protein
MWKKTFQVCHLKGEALLLLGADLDLLRNVTVFVPAITVYMFTAVLYDS